MENRFYRINTASSMQAKRIQWVDVTGVVRLLWVCEFEGKLANLSPAEPIKC